MKPYDRDVQGASKEIHLAALPGKQADRRVQPILDALILGRDDVIVELGAGNSHFTIPIATQLKHSGGSGVVFACDFSEDFALPLDQEAAAQGMDDRVRAICLSASCTRVLPFGNERIQSVLAVNVIQYSVDPQLYLAEIARILLPRGRLLLADWKMGRNHLSSKRSTVGLIPDALYPLIENAGFSIHTSLDLQGYSWAIRAMKSV